MLRADGAGALLGDDLKRPAVELLVPARERNWRDPLVERVMLPAAITCIRRLSVKSISIFDSDGTLGDACGSAVSAFTRASGKFES